MLGNLYRAKFFKSMFLAGVWANFFISSSAISLAAISTEAVALEPSKEVSIKIEQITQNLGVVWAMDWLSEDKIIFTVRSGKAGILDTQSGSVSWLQGLPEVDNDGQGGLLDVAVPKDYAKQGWVYFTYSHPGFLSAQTTLARAKIEQHKLTDWQNLLITNSSSIRNIHYGSRIAFDNRGHLFFTVGDRGQRGNAQDLSNHAGTIIRLNMDGSVPADNPFVNNSDALDEIWSYGHRNPQGLFFDEASQRLWSIEHGPRGGDEINLIEKGANYGWPVVSQGQEYFADLDVGVKHQAGMLEPKKVYTPSIAPSDLLMYRVGDSNKSFQGWQGSLLTGALKLRHLNLVELDTSLQAKSERRYLTDLNKRIRSLLLGPDGSLYIGTDSGEIMQLTPIQ